MSTFDVRDYQDRLTPDGDKKDKHSYNCPMCGAKNFKIESKTGKYNCFSCDCMATDAGKLAMVKAISALKPELNNWQKPARPSQKRTWIYKGFDQKPLIKVHREDFDGSRKIWQQSLVPGVKNPREIAEAIAPYRYDDVLLAEKYNHLLFWVEGEVAADALAKLGLCATTTIGGCENLKNVQYQNLIPGKQIVICPDRDQPGMEYAKRIHEAYPDASWGYFPPSKFYWENLPANHGADVADYIDELQALGKEPIEIREIIKKAIEPTPRVAIEPAPMPTKNSPPTIEEDVVKEELADHEYSQLPDQVLSTLLGEQLYKAHKAKAEGFGIDPAVISVGTLLLFGSQLQADHELVINDLTDYAISPNWCAVGIGETGTMKTPIFEASFNPLAAHQFTHDQKFADKMEAYQRELFEYRSCKAEDKDLPPTEPTPIELYVDNFTIESVMESLKTRANLALCSDEVTSIFNGLGQYQAGKGNSRQMLLKLLSNGAIKINRKGSGRISLQKTSIGLWGMTQPSVWSRDLLKEDVEDGLHPRIALYAIPKGGRIKYSDNVIQLQQRGSNVDYTEFLSNLYKKAAEISARKVRLSPEARKVWQKWDDEIYELVDCEPESKIRGLYPKAKARAAAIALGAHWLTYCQHEHQETAELSAPVLEAAIAFTKWLLSETKALYASWGIGVSRETARIKTLLTKLQAKCTDDGWVDKRWVHRSLSLPKSEIAQELMENLITRRLVETKQEKNKIFIRFTRPLRHSDKTATLTTPQAIPLSEPPSDKSLTKPDCLTKTAPENNYSGSPENNNFVRACQNLSETPSDKQDIDRESDTRVLSECQSNVANKIYTVLSKSEQSRLSPAELTKHFDWQVSQLVKNSPIAQIFQDLLPVAPDGALKAVLLKTRNKTGATARAIEKELEKRHPLVTARR